MFTKFELEVLHTLWRENRDLTKQEIILFTADRTWKPSTINYILKTLAEKKAIAVAGFRRSDAKHYSRSYKATISLEEYAADHLSEMIPQVNFAGVFSQLIGNGKMGQDTIRELRQMLDDFEANKEPNT